SSRFLHSAVASVGMTGVSPYQRHIPLLPDRLSGVGLSFDGIVVSAYLGRTAVVATIPANSITTPLPAPYFAAPTIENAELVNVHRNTTHSRAEQVIPPIAIW